MKPNGRRILLTQGGGFIKRKECRLFLGHFRLNAVLLGKF
jgi:hypothetical protein